MATHDVSRELRGYHGRWTKGGALMHRLAQEATAGGAATRGMSHEDVLAQVHGVGKGTGRRINGHRIDRTQKNKYRVGLLKESGRDTKLYDTPEGAAKAIAEGTHHDEGKSSAFRKAATGAAPAPSTREREISRLSADQKAVYDRNRAAGVPHGEAYRRAIEPPTTRERRAFPKAEQPSGLKLAEGETLGRKVAIRDLPRGYSAVSIEGRKDYAGRPVKAVALMHDTQGHIADLQYSETMHQIRGKVGNIAVGSRLEKGYRHQLKHPDALASLRAEREAAIKRGIPGYTPYTRGSTDISRPLNRSAAEAIKAHELALSRSETKAPTPPASGLSGLSDRTLELMVQRRGYNWKGAERELQQRRAAQEAKLAKGRPAPGSMEARIASVEASFREEGISYTPQDLVATRLDSVLADLRAGDRFITIKVPSGSEISMPRDVAQELANRARGTSGMASAQQRERQAQAYLRKVAGGRLWYMTSPASYAAITAGGLSRPMP